MTKYFRAAAIAALIGSVVACGNTNDDSRAPVLLTVSTITTPNGNVLQSDVHTAIGVNNDIATATLTSQMKNVSLTPTPNNQVTIHRYHVDYVRADGRNQPGVDVPYGFDGAVTATVPAGGSASILFEIVRLTAKLESPLVQLANNRNQIATIATVTFYGTDAVGNTISATGTITVNFSDLG